MGTVRIPEATGSTYTILGTRVAADAYLNGEFDFRRRWNAAPPDDRAAAQVFATRLLLDLTWAADVEPTSNSDIIEASYLLAGCKIVNPGFMGGAGGGDPSRGPVQEVQDTTRRIRFQSTGRAEEARANVIDSFPSQVALKIRPYLVRTGMVSGLPYVSGTDGESVATDDKKFTVED